MTEKRLTVVQMLPALESGGVERGTLEVAAELVRRGHRSIVISAGGRLVPALEAAGSEHVGWPVGKKSLFTLRYVPRLRRFLAEQGVDILHLRSRFPAWVGYLAWRNMDQARRPRLVTTVHGLYTVGRYSAVMTRGERVIAVSHTVRDYILKHYPAVDADKIRVIYRGVDAARFPHGYRPDAAWFNAWEQTFPQLRGKLVVTLPARITRWKGQEDMIPLIKELKARGLAVHGLIVGGAGRKAHFLRELTQKIAAEGLSQDITFTGHRGDLREIMAVSHVVLSLSREPEAFGRTTLEALALGRPVAAYDHGGGHEVLSHLFPEGKVPVANVAALADKVESLLRRPPAVPPSDTFSLSRMLDATLAVYQELAAERRIG